MSAFAFDFDLEDDLDESFDAISPQKSTAADVPPDADNVVLAQESVSGAELPAEEIPLSELVRPTLVRRDLFDARFQLLAQGRDEQAALIDAPADLGGLKTWECAIDPRLAGRRVRGLRVLELGCGTAVPTLLLLDRLFEFLASEIGRTGGAPPASDGEPETEIYLQDYNRSVLELVTFPNVLLAWYFSPLSAQYRASAPDADDSDSDSDSDDRAVTASAHTSGRGHQYERRQGGLTVTPALLAAFRASLDAHRVCMRFFYGGWTTLSAHLAHAGRPPPYDIVLASETIYRTEALDPFLGVLRAATATGVTREASQRSLCLVAAKVLYFGVGGGVQEFVRAVEEERGTVHTVWEHRDGVGRRIMRIEW
ncbi:hypothetical protein BJY52DRAFT_1255579 [Lactarius psammicola]|nr:hypothetical protein BJY52DRAFT_1255579 [Lactarius psammicola]